MKVRFFNLISHDYTAARWTFMMVHLHYPIPHPFTLGAVPTHTQGDETNANGATSWVSAAAAVWLGFP